MRRLLVAVMVVGMMLVPLGAVGAGASPEQVDFEVDTTLDPPGPSFGPFVATGPAVDDGLVCASGVTIGVSPTTKLFTCDDASGTFSIGIAGTGGINFNWTVVGGTGEYGDLHGGGSGFGLACSPDVPECVLDIYQGTLSIDDDSDDVRNGEDNCPDTFNPDQQNHDSDEFGDACDPDDDNDGVVDGSDNFPLVASVCHGHQATILGTSGPDLLTGTPGVDVIMGRGGADAIFALEGDDWVCAGTGDDYVEGGSGRDRVWGQGGDDELVGGTQNDRLRGGSGDDTLLGENGKRDRLFGNSGADTADGGNGVADVCVAEAEVACEV